MKIFIAGANGFVGKNLKEHFLALGEDVYSPRSFELDLQDSDAVKKYLNEHKFDVVINCAITLTSVETNIKMYFNLERCSDSFGRMINVGSGAEYDMRNYTPMLKESQFGKEIPTDIYGFSKYVIGKDIELGCKEIYNLRVCGIYGKYENYKRRFISNNICRTLAGLDITMNKNMKFDYLYVQDFCRMVENFIQASPKRKSYNTATGTPIDLFSLAEIIKEVSGNEKPILVKQDGMNPEYTADNKVYLDEFGPFEFTDHKQAITELYNWYKDESKIDFSSELA